MKIDKKQMLLLTSGSYSFFWIIGVWLNIRGVILPDLINTFNLSYSASGLIFFITLIPSQIGNVTAAFFIKKFPTRFLLSSFCFIIAAIAVALSFSPTYGFFLGIFFLSGFFVNTLLVSVNTLIPDIYSGDLQPKREGAIVLLHLFYALGSITATLFGSKYIIGLLTNIKDMSLIQIIGWRNSFLIISVALLVPMFIYLLTNYKPEAAKSNSLKLKNYLAYLKNKKLIIFAVALACYTGAEIIASGWLFTYLEKGFGLAKSDASIYLMLFFIFLLLGRIGGMKIIQLVRTPTIISVSAVLTTLTFSAGVISKQHFLLSLSGLFFSPLFPLLQSISLNETSGKDNSIKTTIIFVFSALGATLFPYLTGLIGDLIGEITGEPLQGIRMAYLFAAVLMIPLVILVQIGRGRKD